MRRRPRPHPFPLAHPHPLPRALPLAHSIPLITLQNRQRRIALDLAAIRCVLRSFLGQLVPAAEVELGISFVNTAEITRLNESYLHHRGATDVITFDYCEPGLGEGPAAPGLHGDVVICVEQALTQARRFHATWQTELVRYLVHGVLHLRGYDDQCAAARRRMKQAEDQWLRRLRRQFDLCQLGKPRKRSAGPMPAKRLEPRSPHD